MAVEDIAKADYPNGNKKIDLIDTSADKRIPLFSFKYINFSLINCNSSIDSALLRLNVKVKIFFGKIREKRCRNTFLLMVSRAGGTTWVIKLLPFGTFTKLSLFFDFLFGKYFGHVAVLVLKKD